MTATYDGGHSLADRMRRHAGDSQHLYGHLMRAMADDWERGGPVAAICRGYEDAPHGAMIQLRLLAGLFRIVLTGRAEEIVRFYPCLGGTDDPAEAWPAVRPVLVAHVDELHEALEVAPQTNEVGRANALLVGLFTAVARTGLRRVRLLEPGASAGLNLLVDRFRFVNSTWDFGPGDSPLVLQDGISGRIEPVDFTLWSARGCDPFPVDVTSEEGRLRLRSFVWPFQVERHQRLVAAFEIASQAPPRVDPAAAGAWIEERLADEVPSDVLTVVWQSITRLYWPEEETARVAKAVTEAAARIPLAHVAMEYAKRIDTGATLTVDWSPGGAPLSREVLGAVADHGFPVRLAG